MNYCRLIVAGRLTRDPEMRHLPDGKAICAISVVVNRTWKTESGEKKEEATFLDATAFGRSAEVISQYCKKGNEILIEGRLRQENWDDKQTGAKRSKLSVVVDQFQFVGGKREEAPANRATAATTTQPSATTPATPPDEDPIPF